MADVYSVPLLILGNFLSGMETGVRGDGYRGSPGLGNFLSGMETIPFCGLESTDVPLETSLVEWKPREEIDTQDSSAPLGNFLSGMETGRGP